MFAGRTPAADPLQPTGYFRWKAAADRAAAALLLLPGLPIIGLLVLLVRLTSRGPGIYRQARLGLAGRRFMMYKIRTMRHQAEAGCGAVWAQAGDPRITPLGHFLRKFHLDELPQLFNVLKGEMSLVGPRPERPEFVHVLAESVPGYLDRLAVRPGVTGLAQINLPPDSDLDSVHRKLVLDCEYIRRAGPWLDARLFFCTLLRLFKVPERWLLPMLRLGRTVALPAASRGASSGGNGDGLGEGPATPVSVLIEAATRAAKDGNGDGDGNGPGRRHPHGKHRRSDRRIRPR
jgi:lipopolysaccharide/colanic/teichoic acid biosynthesis glycosyltransferase